MAETNYFRDRDLATDSKPRRVARRPVVAVGNHHGLHLPGAALRETPERDAEPSAAQPDGRLLRGAAARQGHPDLAVRCDAGARRDPAADVRASSGPHVARLEATDVRPCPHDRVVLPNGTARLAAALSVVRGGDAVAVSRLQPAGELALGGAAVVEGVGARDPGDACPDSAAGRPCPGGDADGGTRRRRVSVATDVSGVDRVTIRHSSRCRSKDGWSRRLTPKLSRCPLSNVPNP